jgi:phosphate transport system substrate-binding protein
LFRKGKRLIALVGFTVISAAGLAACGGGPNTLALVGSDTTSGVMGAVANSFNAGPSADTASNVPPTLGATQSFTVPSDKRCGQVVYHGTNNPPPNGSTAGINALNADTTGCVDIARSSRDRRDTDPAALEFYAFAKDAVSWARFPNACPGGDAAPAGCAPITLTQAQIQGIYLCTLPGGAAAGNVPSITNWNQVGGDNEPIARYLPQLGSGTLSFFETKILGLTSAQQGVLDDTGCEAGNRPGRVQENSGSAIPAADRDNAIVPYSFANWTAQSNGVEADIRSGAQLGRINNVVPNATTINDGTFIGRRYVNNVVKNGSPSYAAAIDFVGVDSGGNGFLCANTASVNNLITQYGFVLNSLAPAGPGLPNSRCRKNPTPL